MILLQQDLQALDDHWAVTAIGKDNRQRAHDVANARLIGFALGSQFQLDFVEKPTDGELLERLATAYEIAATEGLDALLHPQEKSQSLARQAQAGAFKAFEIKRVLAVPHNDTERLLHVLHLASLAYAGDRWADLRRWVLEHQHDTAVPNEANATWDKRVLFVIYESWLRMFRKDSWNDLHGIAGLIVQLRQEQTAYEPLVLRSESSIDNTSMALRLVALYHWAKATELVSTYMLQGHPGGITQDLDLHFERALSAAHATGDFSLEMLLRWLHIAARRMVAGSLWTATAGINSRVSRFVRSITSTPHPLIELLPPQRSALSEQGLLDPASKAIVIDLPTSGGKTTLAQFRILQALNAFSQDGGWVAYVAPTKALVSQVMRRFRQDFGPLNIRVEQVTGGVEIDTFEEALLNEKQGFDVLVSTPEKLALIIRNKKLAYRPLALVVLDEAHNIEDSERGLRIELLLATIREDCPSANYLLLMPFVPDSATLARWLDSEGGKPISLGSTAWQPNERIVGLVAMKKHAEKVKARHIWSLTYTTVSTTQNAIQLQGQHKLGDNFPLDLSASQAEKLSTLATAAAKVSSGRGASIAIGDSPRTAWSMARHAAHSMEIPTHVSDDIKLVQGFLQTEIGKDFELVAMLARGIGVHHSGLPDEARTLIEWLVEEGHLRLLCATTTIAQGINFPVSSVFLSGIHHRSRRGWIPMSPREFWNLAGRAGRVSQDSVGVVGIATDSEERTANIASFVSEATAAFASRLITLLDDILDRHFEAQFMAVVNDAQWADFRSFVAHLLREASNVSDLVNKTERILRGTLGYSVMKSQNDPKSQKRAATLLSLTNAYAERISKNMGAVALADSTGFDPEGVRTAIEELHTLETKLQVTDWAPNSLFGKGSGLAELIGVMMKIPALNDAINEIAGSGLDRRHVADIAKAWVAGASIQDIAIRYFSGHDTTSKITEACRGISRALVGSGVWGLAALSKLPGSGIAWDSLSEAQQRQFNLLPAFLYHGVNSEEAVLMRMNQVPRSVATKLGDEMRKADGSGRSISVGEAREYVRSLRPDDWTRCLPTGSSLDGTQYRDVWHLLSGEAR